MEMNGLLKLSVCIFMVFLSCKERHYDHPVIVLRDGWKYIPGDTPVADDSKWQTVSVGGGTPPKELRNHPGYAWYKATLVIPSSLKTYAYFPDSLKLGLGCIDDCDQVFLNGELIGQNDITVFSTPPKSPAFQSAVGLWKVERSYVLPVTDRRIHWDRQNVIAVRVFNQYGDGGMYKGIPVVRTIGYEDKLVFDKNELYKVRADYLVDKDLIIRNISARDRLRGKVVVSALNSETRANIYQMATDMDLAAGGSKRIQVNLPVCTDPVKLYFNYIDATTGQEVSDTDSLPYVLSKPQ